MPIPLVRLIIYVRDVPLLKGFYQQHFDLPVIEEIEGEWVVFQAGKVELALHLVGQKYRNKEAAAPTGTAEQGSDEKSDKTAGATTKFVFAIDSDLNAHREKMLAAGIRVGNVKRYEGFPYQMYDGRDPEGNIFQVMQWD